MQKIDRGTRIGTMVLDHIAMSFVAIIFSSPFYFYSIAKSLIDGDFEIFNVGSYFMVLGFALYFCKDCINGRSIAKRGLHLQVVNSKTGIPASPYRCLVRNLFLILWPIEAIVAIINPPRRIGDLVAGTKVVPFDTSMEQPKINYIKVFVSIAICYLMFLPMILFLNIIQNELDVAERDYSESIKRNYYDDGILMTNIDITETIITQLDDSLGNLIIPKGDIYDLPSNEIKKIDLSIWVKKWSLDDNTNIETIHNQVLSIIKNEYPNQDFFGNIEYQYKENEYAASSKITYSVNIMYERQDKGSDSIKKSTKSETITN